MKITNWFICLTINQLLQKLIKANEGQMDISTPWISMEIFILQKKVILILNNQDYGYNIQASKMANVFWLQEQSRLKMVKLFILIMVAAIIYQVNFHY